MADESNLQVTTSMDAPTLSVEVGRPGAEPKVAEHSADSQTVSTDAEELSEEDLAALEADPEEGGGEGNSEEAGTEQDPEETSDEEALPEWDAENEEVASKYDAKYITKDEDGAEVINFEAFNEEFAIDRGEGKRDINPGSRKYLKARFGISDKIIDQHLAGVIAQEQQAEAKTYLQFGATPEEGKAAYNEMFEWGKANYSDAQKARFNEAAKKAQNGDDSELLEQFELLKTRYTTKNPGKVPAEQGQHKIGLQPRRPASPPKSASGRATGGNEASPYANAEEHRVAQAAALKLPAAQQAKALAEVRKRLKASSFWQA